MNNIENMLAMKTWAVVGATNNVGKFGYKIYKFLKNAGYEVFAVNPNVNLVDGDTCYPSLKQLPKLPEVVDIVVPTYICKTILSECKELGITNVWLQPGADSAEVIAYGEELGLSVVYHDCVMVAIKRQGGQKLT